MTAGALNLRVNVDRKVLVVSSGNGGAYVLPALQQGDNVPIILQLLADDPDGSINSDLLITDPSSYSAKIGLFDSVGTQLAFQNSFTVVAADKTQTGFLDLSTAAITTALALTSQLTNTILEIEITIAGNTSTVLQDRAVTLNKSYITTATTGVPPTEIGASQSWSLATFVPRVETSADYTSIIVKSIPSGYRIRLTWDDDGQPHSERIT